MFQYDTSPGHMLTPTWSGTTSSYVVQPWRNGDCRLSILRCNGGLGRGIKVVYNRVGGAMANLYTTHLGTLRKAYHFPVSSMTFSSGGGVYTGPYSSSSGYIYYICDSSSDVLKWTVPAGASCIGWSRLVLECLGVGSTRTAVLRHVRGETATTIGNSFESTEDVDGVNAYLPYDFDLGDITLQAGDEIEIKRITGGANVLGMYAYDHVNPPTDSDEWDISYNSVSGTNPTLGDTSPCIGRGMALEGCFCLGTDTSALGGGSDHRWIGGYNHNTATLDENCSTSGESETINGVAFDRGVSYSPASGRNDIVWNRICTKTNTAMSQAVATFRETFYTTGNYIDYVADVTIPPITSLKLSYLYWFETGFLPGDANELWINDTKQSAVQPENTDRKDFCRSVYYDATRDLSLIAELRPTLLGINGINYTGNRTMPYYRNDGYTSEDISSGLSIGWSHRFWWGDGRVIPSQMLPPEFGEHSTMNYGSR